MGVEIDKYICCIRYRIKENPTLLVHFQCCHKFIYSGGLMKQCSAILISISLIVDYRRCAK